MMHARDGAGTGGNLPPAAPNLGINDYCRYCGYQVTSLPPPIGHHIGLPTGSKIFMGDGIMSYAVEVKGRVYIPSQLY